MMATLGGCGDGYELPSTASMPTCSASDRQNAQEKGMLSSYPYWMMIAGGILVTLGFIGVAFKQKGDETPVSDAEIEPMAEQIKPRTPKKVEWSPAALDPNKEPKKAS